ncbi:hypothetical protein [Calothrix sp. CCY 0018]|uniref:hypothetical protein n=1 Tax=Calothrix sp. CCY 0018 TaxID=3103864 RepID=UPI0039C621D0
MARPIERIEQDIVELEKAIGFIAEQLQNAYSSYLEVLGQALGQQLILASYHLCTQGYPDSFLKLSLNQRQKLQKAMRKLAKSATQDMQALMDDEEEAEETENELEEDLEEEEIEEDLEEEKIDFEDDDLEEIAQELEIEDEDLEEIVENLGMEDEEEPNIFSENASPSSLPLDAKIAFLSAKKGQAPIFLSEPDFDKDWKNWFNPNTSNPMELAAWQKNLERAIGYIIKSLSRDGNRLLQKAGILPTKKLPPQVLEAAVASAEASSDVMPGPPNLLSLVVGIQGEEQQEPENLTQVMALKLRLVEIEFADIKLSSERKQIRNILNQLNKLGREYQKKQREHSIAAAEAAWRASWYED